MESVSDNDADFVVSAEMLIHDDIDDERTLDEEEKMEEQNEIEGELSNLQKESEMPLDQLLAAYGYHSNISTTPEKETQSEKESSPSVVDPANEIMFVDEEGVVSSLPPPSELICVSSEAPVNADPSNIAETAAATDPPLNESVDKQQVPCVNQSDRRSPWFRPGADPEALARLRPVPERRSIRMGAHEDENGDVVVDKTFKMWLTSDLSDEGEDDSSASDEYVSNDWKQTIKVGGEYQAKVPDHPIYSTQLSEDNLVWSPSHIDDESLTEYLSSVEELILSREGLPMGTYQKDNEEALHTLVLCNYDVDKALDNFSRQLLTNKGTAPWTEDECRKFETGLRMLGKDFYSLQKQVPTRTVREIVEFYYLWKKTERYDAFAQQNKTGKKFTVQPGYISDFMEELLEPPHSSEYADIHYGSTTLSTEIKRERSLHLLDDRLRQASKAVSAKSS